MEHLTLEQYHALASTKRAKYGNRKVEYGSYRFDSQAELRRYLVLLSMQQAGEISSLQLQPRYELQPAFTDLDGRKHRAITYTADFAYIDAQGYRIVEECKGGKATQTTAWRIKWKLAIKLYSHIKFKVVEG